MKKIGFSTELAYFAGNILLAFGVSFMELADFGISTSSSVPYVLYLHLSASMPWFTFGVSRTIFQLILLLVVCLIIRRFQLVFFLSFATAAFSSILIDGTMLLLHNLPSDILFHRIIWYILGVCLCSSGLGFIFKTYFMTEVYELFVKVISLKCNLALMKAKTIYDCVNCAAAVLLSFLFFGFRHFEGVKLGTILYALTIGTQIGLFTKLLDRHFVFFDRFPSFHRFLDGRNTLHRE